MKMQLRSLHSKKKSNQRNELFLTHFGNSCCVCFKKGIMEVSKTQMWRFITYVLDHVNGVTVELWDLIYAICSNKHHQAGSYAFTMPAAHIIRPDISFFGVLRMSSLHGSSSSLSSLKWIWRASITDISVMRPLQSVLSNVPTLQLSKWDLKTCPTDMITKCVCGSVHVVIQDTF